MFKVRVIVPGVVALILIGCTSGGNESTSASRAEHIDGQQVYRPISERIESLTIYRYKERTWPVAPDTVIAVNCSDMNPRTVERIARGMTYRPQATTVEPND